MCEKQGKQTHHISKYDSCERSANKTLDCLLRRKLDELSSSKEHAPDVCSYIIHDHQTSRKPEPDNALKSYVHKRHISGVDFDGNSPLTTRRSGPTHLQDIIHDKVA
jgi:hypothetical protein